MASLSTTPEDILFIYFNDHGALGYLGVPDTLDSAIFSNDLVKAFDTMYANHLFNKCLFMIEACYSGSIGKLITTPSVAVITASNDIESSNAAVYDEILETWTPKGFTNNFIS